MILFRRPSQSEVARFIKHSSETELSYSQIGATQHQPPAGFVVDRLRKEIGHSGDHFDVAKAAISELKHLELGWVTGSMLSPIVEEGEIIAITARWASFYFLAACRVVYMIDETRDSVRRFGFGYGTLEDHAECGEERFLLEYDAETQSLAYEILAFSRPNSWYSRLGYPLVRRAQKRFAQDSVAAMSQIVTS